MAVNSRAKGAAGERELSKKLREFGYKSRRGQQYCGSNGDADVVGIDGLHIECKRVERLNIYEAIKQAIDDAREGEIPTVFHRKNRKDWLVTLRMEDFIKIYQQANKTNCKECVHNKNGVVDFPCNICNNNKRANMFRKKED